jgi:hypothetical protein
MPKLSQSDTDVLITNSCHHGEMSKDPVQIRPVEDADRPAVARFIEREWGTAAVVAPWSS